MEDKLVKCEHCGSEMCYASPISETAYSYNCTGCGFTANDMLKDGEYDYELFEGLLLSLSCNLKFNCNSTFNGSFNVKIYDVYTDIEISDYIFVLNLNLYY